MTLFAVISLLIAERGYRGETGDSISKPLSMFHEWVFEFVATIESAALEPIVDLLVV